MKPALCFAFADLSVDQQGVKMISSHILVSSEPLDTGDEDATFDDLPQQGSLNASVEIGRFRRSQTTRCLVKTPIRGNSVGNIQFPNKPPTDGRWAKGFSASITKPELREVG